MRFAITLVVIVWSVFILNVITPWWDINNLGILPREIFGLIGVVASPLLHANLSHIISNTVGMIVLLMILATIHPKKKEEAIIGIVISSGFLYWVIGPSGTVLIGASGLIFGLITFIVVIGFRQANPVAIGTSLLVALFYWGTIFGGVLPGQVPEHVSWLGHLCGAIAGVAVAIKYPLDKDLINFDREAELE